MRMMMKVTIPVEAGNRGVKEGLLPKTVMGFVERMKPESCYFIAEGGKRTGYFFFDLKDPTLIPTVAEPFFMNLHAAIEITPAMNLDDMKAGVEKAMKA
ncbi:MAG: hypothetical protein K8T20_16525 [Planctomycetes bacterium]|nr:hypothetical protein [Planctomycetota bacterium]